MGSKINILHVIDKLRVGGAEKHVVRLANGLDKTRFNSIICCLEGEGPLLKELKGHTTYVFQKKGGLDLNLMLKLRKVIKKEKIDIIHAHHVTQAEYSLVSSILGRTPVIITRHGMHNINMKDVFILKLLYPLASKLLFVSKAALKYYHKKEKVPLKKSLVLYNGICVDDYKNAKPDKIINEFNLKREDIKIGFVGRLFPAKDISCFLHMAKRVSSKINKPRFFIVGGGPSEKKAKEIAYSFGLDNIVFTGFRNDVPQIISAMDIVVLTSVTESCPFVLLETMSAGKPVVASNIGGVPEIIKDGFNGLLATPKHPQEFAENVITLAKSRKLREKIGKNGQKIAESFFSINRFIKNHEKLYGEIVAKKIA
jgi:glycosyltransferase involved in cell wall biosynthesis